MFRFDPSENCLIELDRPSFADLKIGERYHLQEWLAKKPDVLGEELLIIQKEFDGFEGTRERLDLLALDKDGRLVVIENKLDSGRDVVWQAIKYVAYCSSLNRTDIVNIYQQYLGNGNNGDNAKKRLCEFLDVDELDEMVINEGNTQRLVLVATSFRKEVTATVLWLIRHGVRAQCFRVVPYRTGNETLIDIQQIIPTPEAQDYMIKMASKDSEESDQNVKKRRLEELRRQFWGKVLNELNARGVSRFQKFSASDAPIGCRLSVSSGVSGCTYVLTHLVKENTVGVKLLLYRPNREENEQLFDKLEQQKQSLEERFGAKLEWDRLDSYKPSIIFYKGAFNNVLDRENWQEMIDWLCVHIVKLDETFSEQLVALSSQLKSGSDIATESEN